MRLRSLVLAVRHRRWPSHWWRCSCPSVASATPPPSCPTTASAPPSCATARSPTARSRTVRSPTRRSSPARSAPCAPTSTSFRPASTGTCGAARAIGAIDSTGNVTCNATLPAEFGTTNNPRPITGTATGVTSVNLPAGASYLAFANPTATVTGSGTDQRVTVSCTLTVGSNTQTRAATVTTPAPPATTPRCRFRCRSPVPAGTSSVSCLATPATGTLPNDQRDRRRSTASRPPATADLISGAVLLPGRCGRSPPGSRRDACGRAALACG